MTVFTNAYIPYEFKTKDKAYKYITEKALGIKKSLRLIELDEEHMKIRYPISSEVIEITGTNEELQWLHYELTLNSWYRQ